MLSSSDKHSINLIVKNQLIGFSVVFDAYEENVDIIMCALDEIKEAYGI
jgi:hypothetical protein